jgi:hypothetical protein
MIWDSSAKADRVKEQVFYQDVPRARVRRALTINLVALAYAMGMALVTKQLGFATLFWTAIAAIGTLVLLLIYNSGVALGVWLLPMLTLTPEYLVYRKCHIRWSDIVAVKFLETKLGPCLGLVLRDGVGRVVPIKKSRIPRPTSESLIRNDLGRYGAIAVPAARGLGINALRETLSAYRQHALEADNVGNSSSS